MGFKMRFGALKEIDNKNKKFGAAKKYYHVMVADPDPSSPTHLLLTAAELKKAKDRAGDNPEDILEAG